MNSGFEYLRYFPLLSYLIIGIFFEKFNFLKNLRIYFIPIFIGVLLLFIKSPIVFIIGYTFLYFIAPFIKINVLIQIYDYLAFHNIRYDRAYVLMILILNVFSFLSPFITSQLSYNLGMQGNLLFPLLNIAIWSVFALIFFLFPIEKNEHKNTANQKDNSIKLLITGLICVITISYFSKVLGGNLYVESEDYRPEMIRGILQMSILFIAGIILLFTTRFKSNMKINISAYIILFIGVLSLFSGLVNNETIQNITLYSVTGLGALFDILFYPALVFIFLDTFSYKHRAALLSIFYFVEFFVSDISSLLLKVGGGYIISIIFILLLVGIKFLRYEHNKLL